MNAEEREIAIADLDMKAVSLGKELFEANTEVQALRDHLEDNATQMRVQKSQPEADKELQKAFIAELKDQKAQFEQELSVRMGVVANLEARIQAVRDEREHLASLPVL